MKVSRLIAEEEAHEVKTLPSRWKALKCLKNLSGQCWQSASKSILLLQDLRSEHSDIKHIFAVWRSHDYYHYFWCHPEPALESSCFSVFFSIKVIQESSMDTITSKMSKYKNCNPPSQSRALNNNRSDKNCYVIFFQLSRFFDMVMDTL